MRRLPSRLPRSALAALTALALARAPAAAAPDPAAPRRAVPTVRLVDIEIRELGRIAKKARLGREFLDSAAAVGRAADPVRQGLLRELFGAGRAMDQAWGMLWNDEETLAREYPRFLDVLGRLDAHETTRLRDAEAHLGTRGRYRLAVWLEREARKARGKTPLGLIRPAAARKGLAAAWASLETVDPNAAAFLRGLWTRLERDLRPRWDAWAARGKRWEDSPPRGAARAREVAELRSELLGALAATRAAVVAEYRRFPLPARRGLVVTLIRNLRRLRWAIRGGVRVAELDALGK